jgi:hypothetical protein
VRLRAIELLAFDADSVQLFRGTTRVTGRVTVVDEPRAGEPAGYPSLVLTPEQVLAGGVTYKAIVRREILAAARAIGPAIDPA